jgi:hypothetical protein
MWYYTLNNQQVGPVEETEIKKLVTSGVITPATMLWTNGMANWAPIGQTQLASLVGSTAIAPPPVTFAAPVVPDDPKVAEMKTLFMWFWISLIGILIGIGVVSALVLFFIIIYKAWQLVQREGVRGDPDKMVSHCFIPGWNFYWVFPAFRGLAKELNDVMDKENIAAERINLDMVTLMIICLFGASITFGISLIPFIVFWIIYTIKVKNAYNAITVARK